MENRKFYYTLPYSMEGIGKEGNRVYKDSMEKYYVKDNENRTYYLPKEIVERHFTKVYEKEEKILSADTMFNKRFPCEHSVTLYSKALIDFAEKFHNQFKEKPNSAEKPNSSNTELKETAIKMMQGLLANPTTTTHFKDIIKDSINVAKELLSQLNQEK